MIKPIQHRIYYLSLFFTILIISGTGVNISVAQMAISTDQSLQVEFTLSSSVMDGGIHRIQDEDLQSMISPALSDTRRFELAEINGPLFFTTGSRSQALLSRMPFKNDESILFLGSLVNEGDESIGELFIAFDFLYFGINTQIDLNLQLRYKINDGEWKDVPGGELTNSSLPDLQNPDSWESISTQIQLSDLFLREGDELHMMWVDSDGKLAALNETFGLQRFEITAEKAESSSLSEGDLIITEIFPRTEVDGTEFEYLELFNPGSETVNLKGLEVLTDEGFEVIQQNLSIPPHGLMVLSNLDISALPTVSNSYFYKGSLLKPVSGRIDLHMGQTKVASATYDGASPDKSLELVSAENARHGYSSLKDFLESDKSFFENLSGTPGTLGKTEPFFTHSISTGQLMLTVMPGEASVNLTSLRGLELYELSGKAIDVDMLEPQKPVWIKNEGSIPTRMGVTGASNIVQSPLSISPISDNISLITPNFQRNEAVLFGSNWPGLIDQISPVILFWDSGTERFRFRFNGEGDLSVWDPVLLGYHPLTSAVESGNYANRDVPVLTRYLRFSLKKRDTENRSVEDEVILGFFNEDTSGETIRFDLPKVKTRIPETDGQMKPSVHLYLQSVASVQTANAFTHLPYRLKEQVTVPLGFESNLETEVNYRLQWDMNGDLPDEWQIELEDTYTGMRVNMREENTFDFRFLPSEVQNNGDNITREGPSIEPLIPKEAPRFRIIIEPFEVHQEVKQEEEVPDSIELRPNFPNPFNPSTNINFFLPEQRPVRLGIFNIVGQQVATLIDDMVQAGEHTVVWDASDKPSGIYIVQLETGDRIFSRKITLIK